MDRTTQAILRFDRFALDLGRGCLREGGHDVNLRPKTFQVLRHLAENAERLVSKQELHDTVWPNVSVTDDSLIQCIRELRLKLGDDSRRLIKTIPRRGYLLDTNVAPRADSPEPAPITRNRDQPKRLGKWVAISAAVLIAALVAMHASGLRLGWNQANLADVTQAMPAEPFTPADARRVAEIADKKQLPLPDFRIGKPSGGVSGQALRFVGVWVSDKGWSVSNRQLMLIVTDSGEDGIATGYVVHGPPQPRSHTQSQPNFSRFEARIEGDQLAYSDPTGDHSASFTNQNQIMFRSSFRDGVLASVLLDPVWTLVVADGTAHSR